MVGGQEWLELMELMVGRLVFSSHMFHFPRYQQMFGGLTIIFDTTTNQLMVDYNGYVDHRPSNHQLINHQQCFIHGWWNVVVVMVYGLWMVGKEI